jgi:hypothetical protein
MRRLLADEWDEFADPADLDDLDDSLGGGLMPVDVFMRQAIDAWDGAPATNAYHPANPANQHRKHGC